MLPDPLSDPFGERAPSLARKPLQLLGGRFRFDSNSPQLLRLVDWAYAGLPGHWLSSEAPSFHVRLMLMKPGEAPKKRPQRRRLNGSEPPPLEMLHGAGLLGGATATSDVVVMSAREGAALVLVSPQMLRHPYHTRYELIEFAVFTLAARAQRLVPLHAACVGQRGRGILLMGPSSAGKSTVALQCLLGGFEFLSEDSVFVAPDTMLATGVANFLHVRTDSLGWLGRSRAAAAIAKSPVIRRRSGIEKFEVDLRRGPYQLARAPLRIVGVAFLSSRKAGTRPLLRPMSKSLLMDNLLREQAYGAAQPQWQMFRKNISKLPAFELRRGDHPAEAAEALRSLLAGL